MGTIISADDREPIWAESYSYRTIYTLDSSFELNAVKGVRWLAGDSAIVTAGHNPYDQIQGGLALFCRARLELPLLVDHLRIFFILCLSEISTARIV